MVYGSVVGIVALNTRGITHPIEDFTKSVWAFPVNGYLGDKGYLFDSG